MARATKKADTTAPVPPPRTGEEIAIAYGDRDITRWGLKPNGELINEDVVLQLQCGGDLRVYEDLMRDDQVLATWEQRTKAVTAANWSVEAGAEDGPSVAAAEWLEKCLHHVGWDDVTQMMLSTRFYGWGVAELLWEVRDGLLGWREIRVRDRKRFLFQGDGRCYLNMPMKSEAERVYCEAPYFWTLAAGADHSDNPYGRGLANQLYWPVRFKRDGIRFWLVYLEKFAQPTALGKYKPGEATDAARRQKLLRALHAIATQAGVVIPDDMAIELLEAKRSGSVDYAALVQRMDAAISKVVVGQTLTADVSSDGGSRALGSVHNSVRYDLVKSDADLICEGFNKGPVTWLTALNFAGATPPRVRRETEEGADLGALATQLVQLKTVGFRPKLELVQSNWGGDMEENPDPPPELGGPGGPGKPVPRDPAEAKKDEAAFAAAMGALFADQVALDQGLDLFEDRLAKLSRAMLAPALQFVGDHTPAEVAAALAISVPGLNTDQLTDVLAQVIFASRTWGKASGAIT